MRQIHAKWRQNYADSIKLHRKHRRQVKSSVRTYRFLKKGDPFFLWPQNSPGKMDTHARYLHYHNELELGWCMEGSGIFLWRIRSSHFRLPVPRSSTRADHIAQSNPDKPAKWYFINVDECILSAKDDESLTAGHIGAPILDDSTAEGRDILTLVQMVVDELQAKRPGSRQMRRVAGEKHSIQACTSLRPPPGCPLASCRSLTCSDLCFQPLCRALPDRNAGTALQYERIDPASKILQRIGMRAFRLYPPRPHRSGNGNAFRRE